MENNRIVLINNIPSPYFADLCRALQNKYPEYEFHVIFTSDTEGDRNWSGNEEGLDHVTVLKSMVIPLKTLHDQRYVHLPALITKELDRIRPAAVFAKEYNPSALAALYWCKTNGRKYIHVTEGTMVNERRLNPVQKQARKLILAGADACIAASTKAKEKLLFWKCTEEKIHTSYLTFDMHAFSDAERTPVPGRILYTGGLQERKGVDLLIRALPYVMMPFELHIAGSGSEEELASLKKLADSLRVSDRIVWKGYLTGNDLVKEYAEASLFVMPSREDCFGLVLLEAAVTGVPVVSSKYADGAYDVIENGVNGLIVNPQVASEFGSAIRRVLLDPSFADHAAKADLSKFSLEENASVYMDVLRELALNSANDEGKKDKTAEAPAMGDVLTLREVQMAELEILLKFDAFCKKHDLHYVLYYGTLLGAVRHQGFIPWDDDIDVAMPRPDYQKLLKLYYEDHEDLGENLFMLSGEHDDDFAFAYAKIARSDSEILQESKLYEHEGDGIWIDVFPIDGFPPKEEQEAYLKKLGEYRRNIGRAITIPGTVRGNESRMKSLARIPVVAAAHAMGYRKYRDELIALANSYPFDTSEYVGLATWNDNSEALVMKHDAFVDYTTLPFEGYDLPVFADYDDFCTRRYGKNYMELPPEHVRQSHYIKARLK